VRFTTRYAYIIKHATFGGNEVRALLDSLLGALLQHARPGAADQEAWVRPLTAIDDGTISELVIAAGQRLLGLDPLLPAQPAPPDGCGTTLTAVNGDGDPVAVASCQHWTDEPGAISLTWGAARRFHLHPRIAGSKSRPASGADVAGALDRLITQWSDHLAGVPEIAEEDTAAVVTWPSRDVDSIRVLQRHGLAPLAVIAARATARTAARTAAGRPEEQPDEQPADGLTIRRAAPADLEAVTDLGVELVRYDAYFGEVVERPNTREGLRRGSAEMLADPAPWVWLAEKDGVPVGLLAAERPEAAAWLVPLTGRAPAAYLQQGFVLPAERASGIGARLVRQFHAEADTTGVAVTLLHYSQANPLSVPFWSQQGYRPLWTVWEARPARRLC
jgi:GNAT superfamily N-acetyltransferase